MLIAIAGCDGAGKSTLTAALVRALRDTGIDAIGLSRFDILDHGLSPASGFIDCDILTLRNSVMAMPTATARLLFMLWSMAVTVSSQRDAAPRDRVIVYDSYWMKHTAVEIVFGADEGAALAAASMLPVPDITFHARLPVEVALARKPDDRVPYECGMDGACSPESFLVHQRRIQRLMNGWSVEFGWIEIDAAQPPDLIVPSLTRTVEAAWQRIKAGSPE